MMMASEWGTTPSRGSSEPLATHSAVSKRQSGRKKRVKVTVCRLNLSITGAATVGLPLAPCGAGGEMLPPRDRPLPGSRPHRYKTFDCVKGLSGLGVPD